MGTKKKSGTIILPCTCHSVFQDTKQGPGLRVHNIMGNGKQARCSNCGTVHDMPHKDNGAIEET